MIIGHTELRAFRSTLLVSTTESVVNALMLNPTATFCLKSQEPPLLSQLSFSLLLERKLIVGLKLYLIVYLLAKTMEVLKGERWVYSRGVTQYHYDAYVTPAGALYNSSLTGIKSSRDH